MTSRLATEKGGNFSRVGNSSDWFPPPAFLRANHATLAAATFATFERWGFWRCLIPIWEDKKLLLMTSFSVQFHGDFAGRHNDVWRGCLTSRPKWFLKEVSRPSSIYVSIYCLYLPLQLLGQACQIGCCYEPWNPWPKHRQRPCFFGGVGIFKMSRFSGYSEFSGKCRKNGTLKGCCPSDMLFIFP